MARIPAGSADTAACHTPARRTPVASVAALPTAGPSAMTRSPLLRLWIGSGFLPWADRTSLMKSNEAELSRTVSSTLGGSVVATLGTRSWGMILLAIYLILVGLGVFGLVLPALLTGIIALLAGILILVPLVR